MRTLMWFATGFAASCAGAVFFMSGARQGVLLLLVGLLAGGALLYSLRKKRIGVFLASLVGCGVGVLWFFLYFQWMIRPLMAVDDTQSICAVTISDYSTETSGGSRADGLVMVGDREYRASLFFRDKLTLKPGDVVTGEYHRKHTLPDEEESSAYYPGQGVFLTMYPAGQVQITESDSVPGRFFPAVLRNRIQTIIDDVFPGDVSGFVRALLLGDTDQLSYELETAFRLSGIRHIVAVSGLHISILYSLISLIAFRQRHLSALLGIPVLVVFAAVAGFTPSVTRSCIMVCLMLLAGIWNREYDPPVALSAAVLGMLLVNPWVIASVSLQLSAGCVAGILLFQGRISGWLQKYLPGKKGVPGKLCKTLCAGVSITVSSMSLVTPLSAVYFGAVSMVSVVTNLLTLWVVNLIFSGSVAVILISIVSQPAAVFLAEILSVPIRFVFQAAKALGSFPLAAVYTRSVYIVAWLVFLYLLLAVFLLSSEKRPATLICCAVIGLCVALLASWTEPELDDVRLTMLDVGQGQSILFQTEGRTFLVDCGGDRDEKTADIVAETLLSQGITRLDGVILTHYDRDHAGGAPYLLSRVETDCLFLPAGSQEDSPMKAERTIYVREDIRLSVGAAELTIFGPQYLGDENENSLCVLFDTEKCDILITGDRSKIGERMLLRHTRLPDVDVLVAGHHGAGSSTSEELLRAVRPEIVLISVGADNRYGHPAPGLLERLERFGCQIYRTDRNGTITIRR